MRKVISFLGISLCIVVHTWAAGSRFNQLLDGIVFESSDIVGRLDGYKKLVDYAQRRELDAQSLVRFMDALDGTYRVRDLANKASLLGLQEVFGKILMTPVFASYHQQVQAFLEKLKYDLMPFAIKFGDYVTIEACERHVFCAAQQRAGETLVHGRRQEKGKQVCVDSLFKLEGGVVGQPVLFGQQVQISPLYVQQGGYILPPRETLHVTYHQDGYRGANEKKLFLHKDGAVKFAAVGILGDVLQGMPVIGSQGFRLVDATNNLAWALPIGVDKLVVQPKSGVDCELFALRTIKPRVIEQAHQKLVRANTDIASKRATAEARVAGLTKILTAVCVGIDGNALVQQQEILQSLYTDRAGLPPPGLRALKKLFDIAATHPCFAASRLSFEQYAGQVLDDLKAKALKFEEFVTMTSLDHHRVVQLSMDEQLSQQGHLIVSGDGQPNNGVVGQQCMMLASPAGRRGALCYGDEIKLMSFFVHDGRSGGLLACPVVWWVDGNPATRVCASSRKAVQTHSGQEVFIVAANNNGLSGPVLAGDKINLVSKYAQGVISFMPGNAGLEIQPVPSDRLRALADTCFGQYIKQAETVSDVGKKVAMLASAVDLFKEQKLLSSSVGKILYSALKQAATNGKAGPSIVPNMQALLAKAQAAPFSAAAKKRFIVWSSGLNPAQKVVVVKQ